jgi:hypothetical protein
VPEPKGAHRLDDFVAGMSHDACHVHADLLECSFLSSSLTAHADGVLRVCEALGDVTYNSPTGLVVAQQCADGGIWFDGTRYSGVSDWLRKCFSKRI